MVARTGSCAEVPLSWIRCDVEAKATLAAGAIWVRTAIEPHLVRRMCCPKSLVLREHLRLPTAGGGVVAGRTCCEKKPDYWDERRRSSAEFSCRLAPIAAHVPSPPTMPTCAADARPGRRAG